MGYTKEYITWLEEKYGEEDEDFDDLIERLGEDTAPFGRMEEFARDVLADAVERARGKRPRWDAFISYAGEHLDAVVEPLTKALRKHGLKVWFDGEQYPRREPWKGILYRFIHEGIALSRVGIVVVSPEYVAKAWTKQEYFGLRLKGLSRLFFVLHGANARVLRSLDPELAAGPEKARVAVATTAKHSIKVIARQIADFVDAAGKQGKGKAKAPNRRGRAGTPA